VLFFLSGENETLRIAKIQRRKYTLCKFIRSHSLCGCPHVNLFIGDPAIETERQRDRETERQRDRETERQRDRETERQRDRETERQRDRETERQRDRETERQRDRETERQRDRDRETERQKDREIHIPRPETTSLKMFFLFGQELNKWPECREKKRKMYEEV
jgi:hypothetical protein